MPREMYYRDVVSRRRCDSKTYALKLSCGHEVGRRATEATCKKASCDKCREREAQAYRDVAAITERSDGLWDENGDSERLAR